MTKQVLRIKGGGGDLERSKDFQIGISHDLMYAFQNGFHHENCHILFLN